MIDPVSRSSHGSVVILSNGGASTRAIHHALAARFAIGGVIVERPVSRRYLLRRRAARVGWARAIDQALFSIVLVPLLRRGSRSRLSDLTERLHADGPLPQGETILVGSVNDTASIDALRRLRPSVVVLSGTRIVSDAVLHAVAVPFLNVHAGITPRYRGVHGAYWALVEGRPTSAGVTVHLVDAGIDTGHIVAQARIEPGSTDTVVTYPLLQIEAGLPLLVDAVGRVLESAPLPTVASLDESVSKLWYHPGAIAYLFRRVARGVR